MRDQVFTGEQRKGSVSAESVMGGEEREFLRLPSSGRCPICGLSRSYLNSLILGSVENDFRPPVKSFALRKRGKQRGVRLIDYRSLRDYITSNPDRKLTQ